MDVLLKITHLTLGDSFLWCICFSKQGLAFLPFCSLVHSDTNFEGDFSLPSRQRGRSKLHTSMRTNKNERNERWFFIFMAPLSEWGWNKSSWWSRYGECWQRISENGALLFWRNVERESIPVRGKCNIPVNKCFQTLLRHPVSTIDTKFSLRFIISFRNPNDVADYAIET